MKVWQILALINVLRLEPTLIRQATKLVDGTKNSKGLWDCANIGKQVNFGLGDRLQRYTQKLCKLNNDNE